MPTSMSFHMRVLGHTVTVEGSDPGMWSEGGMGRSSIAANRIQINSALPQDTYHSTLLHELLHMIADHAGLKLAEHQISTLAAGLYSTMRDNPTMFAQMAHNEHIMEDF